jgi:hypothetical protein
MKEEALGFILALRSLSHQLLDAFLKLRKATLSSVMPVRPTAWNNAAPTGRIFMKFDIWVFLENLRENSSFIKAEKNYRYFT